MFCCNHAIKRQSILYLLSEILLHGNLDVQIDKADSVGCAGGLTAFGTEGLACLCVCLQAVSCRSAYYTPESTFRVSIHVAGAEVGRTHDAIIEEWKQTIPIILAHQASKVEFRIEQQHALGNFFRVGTVEVPAKKIIENLVIDEAIQIRRELRKLVNCVWGVRLTLKIRFTPHDEDNLNLCSELANVHYPMHHRGRVTLYQDACSKMDKVGNFENRSCWNDISVALLTSKTYIFIAGWAFHHSIKLDREKELTLGDLLKKKSTEGVNVRLLIWNDPTKFMNTGANETFDFFKNSDVRCILVPRPSRKRNNYFNQKVEEYIFAHHQKCVIVDVAEDVGEGEKTIAFIGGLDLCKGRHDNSDHTFMDFCDDDVYNPTYTVEEVAPRQPWHDLHCRIEGPAANDVLENFVARWKSISSEDENFEIHGRQDSSPIDAGNWHVQVFRSIDSDSVDNLLDDTPILYPSHTSQLHKRHLKDTSIHQAYVKAIRSAKDFIYIENQFFIGSSYAWDCKKDSGADNVIPMELALKIISKIKAHQRFAVYIVMPMWPEGSPDSEPVQVLLYFQRQTMKMMYRIIAAALKEFNMGNAHPSDFINFYCLGQREKFPLNVHPDHKRVSASLEKGRFMIYVHSKLMIVDDEYVILGSANINQRSMAGWRDTEIAMGSYQPSYTGNTRTHGQVCGYRKSLWAEHLGSNDARFEDPKSIDCVKAVNEVAKQNWEKYTAEEFYQLKGHILPYPIAVDSDGVVKALDGFEKFPDVGGKISGKWFPCTRRLLT